MPPVEIHDLPEQRDFLHALPHERLDLGDDFRDGPGPFRPARARDDAEGAVHVAALHDRDERADLVRREEMIADRVLRAGLLGDIDDRVRVRAPGFSRRWRKSSST